MSHEYKSLDFYQIIYEESQREQCYPFAKVYYNETLTDYFENDVIARLVPDSQADLISVCSWRLAQKRGDCYRLGDKSLSVDKILNQDFDVAVLTPRSKNHKPLLMASEWHRIYDPQGNLISTPWDDAFSELKVFLKTIGINVPEELSKAIYENHFIAKAEIYKDYVNNCLKQTIAFMDTSGLDVFRADAGYLNKKRDPKEIKAYQEKSGRKDWPISTFILERLFSIYCEGKNFKIINL